MWFCLFLGSGGALLFFSSVVYPSGGVRHDMASALVFVSYSGFWVLWGVLQKLDFSAHEIKVLIGLWLRNQLYGEG